MGVLIGFNEPMARRIVAASDFTLMPSRFEPCGLVQMQAQRYGALPIAHATGGLADTIDDGTTGFLFSDLTSDGLMSACHRAFDAYEDSAQLADMRRAAMARSFGWAGAAAEYEALYRRLIGPKAAIRSATAQTRPLTLDLGSADFLTQEILPLDIAPDRLVPNLSTPHHSPPDQPSPDHSPPAAPPQQTVPQMALDPTA
jgi:hypothetical protein